ncbi:MAG: hypothetical protein PHN56_02855, partial [Candidatus Nanoarchaeia archaeon]|nr:hypothetical protein [Candidatus Nanoarchaeia archaeon]
MADFKDSGYSKLTQVVDSAGKLTPIVGEAYKNYLILNTANEVLDKTDFKDVELKLPNDNNLKLTE